MKELGCPPAGKVRWTVTRRTGQERLGIVEAQTWFAACAIAVIQFQVERAEIDVVLERGNP